MPLSNPTLPEIADASDADEPRPEPPMRDRTTPDIASANPDSDPSVDKLKRELQEERDRHNREMAAYQQNAQVMRESLIAAVSFDRAQLQRLQNMTAQCQFKEMLNALNFTLQ